MRKEDFKVYSNPDIRKKVMEPEKEVVFDLEIPDEDTITALFLATPYCASLMREQDALYYPTDLTAEESLMAPLSSEEVFWDFVESSKIVRLKEKILLAPLLHVYVEGDYGEMHMISLFDGPIQMEFLRFFKTAVMVINVDAALEEEFDDAFMELMDQLEKNGYLDEVMNNIAVFMDDPVVLCEVLFPSDEEE